MSKDIKYKILIFDDDPAYLDSLEEEIYSCTNSAKYNIYIKKTTSSRYAMEYAESTLFDVFILDICNRQGSNKPTDMYDYQGQDLYDNLLDKHPKLVYTSKFFILSNLKPDIAKRIFGYKDADYLYKQECNCKSMAKLVKLYFDSHFKQNYERHLICDNTPCIGTINAKNIQINIANNKSNIVATQKMQQPLNIEELVEVIKCNIPSNITAAEKEQINDYLNRILIELEEIKPRKNLLNKIVCALKTIKGTAEFGAAIVALAEYISTVIK